MLALQGAFEAHRQVIEGLGRPTRPVRLPADLDEVDAIVVPGGESTTMSRLLDTSGLRAPLESRLAEGMPAMGTCAGAILLGAEILDGRADQNPLGAIDVSVRRNGYGRQVDSFEADLRLGEDTPFRAIFIRAPRIERCGPGVGVIAEVDGDPVACEEGSVLIATFHPELSGDDRLHRRFCALV